MKSKSVVAFWTLITSMALLCASSAFQRDVAATPKENRDFQPFGSASISAVERDALEFESETRIVGSRALNVQTLSLRLNIRLARASERWRSSRSVRNDSGSERSNPASRATQWSPHFLARNFLTPRKPNEALFLLLLTLRN